MSKVILPHEAVAVHERILRWSDELRSSKFTGAIRVSTPEQADYDYVSRSLDAQAEEIATFKNEYYLDFDGTPHGFGSRHHPFFYEYTHTATESGKSWGPDVTSAINHAAETNRILVCCGLDRFSRQSLSSIISRLVEADIRLLVLHLGRPVDPDEIISGEHQSLEKSRNTKRGLRFKRKHDIGTPSGRPKREADPDTIDYALQLQWEGKSLSKIAASLNDRQLPPGGWNVSNVRRMLKEAEANRFKKAKDSEPTSTTTETE
jgi:hypothetical protein